MTMPEVLEVAAYWAGRTLPGTSYVPCIDAGEPDCFACGVWGRYDAETWGRSRTWERGVTLDRAHVIPQSLGGSDDLGNLVLLCHECHVAAPDTADPRHMWQWLADHPRTGDHMDYLLGSHYDRGPVVSTATWQAVLSDLLRRNWHRLPAVQDDLFGTVADPAA